VKFYRLCVMVLLVVSLTGCVLTKVVTVPMHVVGAVVSVLGAAVDESIDDLADVVDEIPL